MLNKYSKTFERYSITFSVLSIALFIIYMLDKKLAIGFSINFKVYGIAFCVLGITLGLLARNGKPQQMIIFKILYFTRIFINWFKKSNNEN